jgi:hypothetical protein
MKIIIKAGDYDDEGGSVSIAHWMPEIHAGKEKLGLCAVLCVPCVRSPFIVTNGPCMPCTVHCRLKIHAGRSCMSCRYGTGAGNDDDDMI